MAEDLTSYDAGPVESGLDTYGPDFSSVLILGSGSKNSSSGINRGIGPRSGMAPIPGQQHTEDDGLTEPVGLRQTEDAGNLYSYSERLRVYGVVAISEYFPGTGYTQKQIYYAWLVGRDEAGQSRIDIVISASQNSTFTYPAPDVASGVNYAITSGTANTHFVYEPAFFDLEITTEFPTTAIFDLLKGYGKNFLPHAEMTVSGSDVPMNWVFYGKLSNQSALIPPNGNFNLRNVSNQAFIPLGQPSCVNLSNFKNTERSIRFYTLCLDGLYGVALAYIYNYNNKVIPSDLYVPRQDFNFDDPSLDFSTIGNASSRDGRLDGTVISDNNSGESGVLLYDPEMFTNSGYKAVFMAGKKPVMAFIQGWNRGPYGYPFAFVDLTNIRLKPRTGLTYDMITNTSPLSEYTEDGVKKATCWRAWPKFVSGVPAVKASSSPRTSQTINAANSLVALGDAGSGVLRANRVYEFAFSIYNKLYGTETNVGAPAKLQTGSDDFVAVTLFRDIFSTVYKQSVAAGQTVQPIRVYDRDSSPLLEVRFLPTNYIEYRVYYRELGSFEWLPALFIDSSQFLYYPEFRDGCWMCQAPIAALPGGQPGGFVDYSEIPVDEYTCVLVWKNRTFWFSDKQMVFSLRDNPFAYPGRNSAPAPTGGLRGAIVHTYRGQSEQESRLVIFGAKETYIGRFTGNQVIQPVVVSPDNIGEFPVDGTDFNVETWTSITAFSYRSAVVADGDLYWWGPQGVYVDNGVGNPQKLSKDIEPYIFNIYDTSKWDEIHCSFDNKTRQITWYYSPIDGSDTTHGLILNIETGKFYPAEFNCKIDWAQQIDTSNVQTSQKTNGLRTVIGVRENASETLQRAYFYDQNNRSGDLKPGTEFMIKEIAAGPSSLERVLTFASGFDAANLASMAVGDLIAITQFKNYSGQATGDQMIAKITAVSLTGLTIRLPDGATLPSVVLGPKTFAPIWHATPEGEGLNGFSWSIFFKYWMPAGVRVFMYFQWIFMFFKYIPWLKINKNEFNFGYRTPSSGEPISDTIEFDNNSDGNFQVYHALREGQLNSQGQAIQMSMSGVHIGEEWILQYLGADTSTETGNPIKTYQG